MSSSPQPGYYADPSVPGYVRYWDGAAWVAGSSRPAARAGERPGVPGRARTAGHGAVVPPAPEVTGVQATREPATGTATGRTAAGTAADLQPHPKVVRPYVLRAEGAAAGTTLIRATSAMPTSAMPTSAEPAPAVPVPARTGSESRSLVPSPSVPPQVAWNGRPAERPAERSAERREVMETCLPGVSATGARPGGTRTADGGQAALSTAGDRVAQAARTHPAALRPRLLARLIDSVVPVVTGVLVGIPIAGAVLAHLDAKIAMKTLEAQLNGQILRVWLVDSKVIGHYLLFVTIVALAGFLCEVPQAAWRGRTLGKRLMGLAVVSSEDHRSPSLAQTLVRWAVLQPLTLLGVGLAGVICGLRDRSGRRGWHDRAARTTVVRVEGSHIDWTR